MVNQLIYWSLWSYVIIQAIWLIHIHGWKFIIWSNANRHRYIYHFQFVIGSGKVILVHQKYSMKDGRRHIERTYLCKFPRWFLKIPKPLKNKLLL